MVQEYKEQDKSGVLGWMNGSCTDLSLQWVVETMSQEFVFKLCYITNLKYLHYLTWVTNVTWLNVNWTLENGGTQTK